MNNSNSDFTQGSIIKKLITFMIPILGALILQAAYGAVDLMVVGRFGTTSGLSAVSTGSQVLVAGFHLDAAGVAIATVTAQAISVVFALFLLVKKELPFKISKEDFNINNHAGGHLRSDFRLHFRSVSRRCHFLLFVHLSTDWA